jgi:hypothetical protein
MADTKHTDTTALVIDARGATRGAAEAAAAAKKIEAAGVELERSTRRVTDTMRGQEKFLDGLTRKYDPAAAAAAKFAREQQRLNGIIAGGGANSARAAALLQTVTQAQAGATRAATSMASIYGKLTPLMGAFGITLGVAGVVQFGRSVLDLVGSLGEAAEQLGVGTQSLQVYQYAAGQAGAKSAQLESGLANLTRTIGQASEGNAQAIDRFNQLGVGILDANGKLRSTDDVLQDVARSIAAIEDPTLQAAAASALFGDKIGQKLLPFLKDLAKGYGTMKEEALAAGVVVREDLIKSFDDFSDSVDRSILRLKVWSAELVGAANRGAKDFSAAVAGNASGMGEGALRATAAQLDAAIAAKRGEIARLKQNGAAMYGATPKGALSVLEQQLAELEGKSYSVNAALVDLGRGTGMEAWEMADAGVAGVGYGSGVTSNPVSDAARKKAESDAAAERKRIVAEADAADRESYNLWWRRQEDVRKAAAETEKSEARRNASLEKYIGGLEAAATLEEQTGVERDVSRAILEAENKLIDEQGNKLRALTPEETARIERAVRVRDEFEKTNEAQKAATQELERFADRAFDRIGNAMTEMAMEGKSAFESFRNVGKAVVSELMQEFIRLAAVNPLKNALFNSGAPTLATVASSSIWDDIADWFGFAEGGWVNGRSGRDRVPARLTSGEFVVKPGPARRNARILEAINDNRLGALGEHGDNMVAFLNRREMRLLERLSGNRTRNRATGWRQFYDAPGDGWGGPTDQGWGGADMGWGGPGSDAGPGAADEGHREMQEAAALTGLGRGVWGGGAGWGYDVSDAEEESLGRALVENYNRNRGFFDPSWSLDHPKGLSFGLGVQTKSIMERIGDMLVSALTFGFVDPALHGHLGVKGQFSDLSLTPAAGILGRVSPGVAALAGLFGKVDDMLGSRISLGKDISLESLSGGGFPGAFTDSLGGGEAALIAALVEAGVIPAEAAPIVNPWKWFNVPWWVRKGYKADPYPMAEGGIVMGGRGGVVARIGETANDEVVVPLPRTGAGLKVDNEPVVKALERMIRMQAETTAALEDRLVAQERQLNELNRRLARRAS